MLYDQSARRNQAGDFGVAEIAEQAKDVPVNRLFPKALARIEIAADERSLNVRIERRAVEREQPALAIAHHPDRR